MALAVAYHDSGNKIRGVIPPTYARPTTASHILPLTPTSPTHISTSPFSLSEPDPDVVVQSSHSLCPALVSEDDTE